MAAARRDGPVHEQHVAVEDAHVLHRPPPRPHQEGGLRMLDQPRRKIDALGAQVIGRRREAGVHGRQQFERGDGLGRRGAAGHKY
jgi:hypothetical protein